MAARRLQQEVDKCFKKVAEGIADFDEIYEKIEHSNNPAQKEKLEDNLKREIKKLQRMRDQIKTWASSNDIKDKAPLMDHRKLIESRMEKFKAVEKLMKTKAFSKEGLSAAAMMDPKEKAKDEASEFLASQVEELEQRIEALEAERETLQATKKGKKSKDNTARMGEIEDTIEKHRWHMGKLELVRRHLVNGGVDAKQVEDIKDAILYYVQEGESIDYVDDDTMYEELNMDEDDDQFGLTTDDKISTQDTQSLAEELPDTEARSSSAARGKERATVDATASATRKPAAQLKSPLPSLATLSTPSLPTISASTPSIPAMKPAAVPTRPPGEGLKYASAAAAAADKSNVGIAPLPPPPGASTVASISQSKTSSPSISTIPMAAPVSQPAETKPPPPTTATATSASSSAPTPAPSTPKPDVQKPASSRTAGKASVAPEPSEAPKGEFGAKRPPFHMFPWPLANLAYSAPHTNGVTNGVKTAEPQNEESIYHLPASLSDLVDAWEVTKANIQHPSSPAVQRMIAASREMAPEPSDSEPSRHVKPGSWWDTSATWPKERLPIIDNPALYQSAKVDNDTLFYAFYYKQGTYQQYLAAKALKDQAWRFHKQYQTWFQRHEEPKNITEEFEQGTYRFFDYESTWWVSLICYYLTAKEAQINFTFIYRMNRRKADFKFAYKFLEDEV